jgi:hypothetical protein
LALVLLPACTPVKAAGTRNVALTMVYKGETYSFTQAAEEGRQSTFSGQVRGRNGTARNLIFNSMLSREGSGDYRLQYQAELGAAEDKGRSPVQLQADIVIPPNHGILAAEGADWKVYLKIRAQAVKDTRKRAATDAKVTADASIQGLDLPLRLMISPGTQASYIAELEKDGIPYTYSLSLLSGRPDASGRTTLQYALTLKTPGRDVLKTSGETGLKPGGRPKTAAAGNGWKLELRVSKP